MDKKKVIKIILTVLIAALTALGSFFGLSSCNVTRKVTTEATHITKGDTAQSIVTKTTETYSAKKQ